MPPSFQEDMISKYPALALLTKLGYTYLSPAEALAARDGKTTKVLLEGILREALDRINEIQPGSGRKAVKFSEANLSNAVQALKDMPLHEGTTVANKKAWELLRYGKALEQTVDEDKKSHTLHYIDWERPERNSYHVTTEFSVARSGRQDNFRPDIVLFVNGIPLGVIECKRPDKPGSIASSISQHMRNQQEDGIRPLYVYSQLLLGLATTVASYATTDTKEEFWASWRERYSGATEATREKEQEKDEAQLNALVNQPLPSGLAQRLYADCTPAERAELMARAALPQVTSTQDQYLYWLARPERLLDLTGHFILFEGSTKKICRYQQYFAIKKIMARIKTLQGGKRKGGVVWHTQGSGKSLTMVMLAQQIAQTVRNPKIVLVTDRVELDEQITETFGRIDKGFVRNATTGNQLVELLRSPDDAVVTTVINKFEAAVNRLTTPLTSPDIFVLIDEGHRTQYGSFNVKMQQVLPNACFLAFTGTPLVKVEKNTAKHFGGIIDSYTVMQAVEDKAVVPIVYEGRHALQDVNQGALDRGFLMVMEDAPEADSVEMRKKFSRSEMVNKTEQRIHAIVRDISRHYSSNWGADKKGERQGFKGMVVCPDRHTAVLYKEAFDLVGRVTTEIVMSAVDDREGNDDINTGPSDKVVAYWKKVVDRYGRDPKTIETDIRQRFKTQDSPELLIVVDKLLTGFDEPKVIVMYLCRKLRGHTLLQAIARVNRVAQGKDYGFVVDYDGVIEELYAAMQQYAYEGEYNKEDLLGTFTELSKEWQQLRSAHGELKDLFKILRNPLDVTAHLQLLSDEARRMEFYEKFNRFARLLKLAHCSLEWEENTPKPQKEVYAKDLKFYANLRNAAVHQYSDKPDYQQYERQLQKLLDQHVSTDEVIRLTELVSITDKKAFEEELEKVTGAAAKAETIASRTTKYINENMDMDPAYYLRLSEMIRQTIAEYRAQRISELEYLERMKEFQNQALDRQTEDTPPPLRDHAVAQTFFREFGATFESRFTDAGLKEKVGVDLALAIDRIIQAHLVVDWKRNEDVKKRMVFEIGEYLIDQVRTGYGIKMSYEEIDGFAERCVEIGEHRY
jgi:type I restriction enzyme R subunit